jgi:hypothetical protein
VLNHVLLHQTIIGEEALLQLAKIGETPDLVVRSWHRLMLWGQQLWLTWGYLGLTL